MAQGKILGEMPFVLVPDRKGKKDFQFRNFMPVYKFETVLNIDDGMLQVVQECPFATWRAATIKNKALVYDPEVDGDRVIEVGEYSRLYEKVKSEEILEQVRQVAISTKTQVYFVEFLLHNGAWQEWFWDYVLVSESDKVIPKKEIERNMKPHYRTFEVDISYADQRRLENVALFGGVSWRQFWFVGGCLAIRWEANVERGYSSGLDMRDDYGDRSDTVTREIAIPMGEAWPDDYQNVMRDGSWLKLDRGMSKRPMTTKCVVTIKMDASEGVAKGRMRERLVHCPVKLEGVKQ